MHAYAEKQLQRPSQYCQESEQLHQAERFTRVTGICVLQACSYIQQAMREINLIDWSDRCLDAPACVGKGLLLHATT